MGAAGRAPRRHGRPVRRRRALRGFGAPRSHEDDSERAVRAALAIQRALGRYAQEVREALRRRARRSNRDQHGPGRDPARERRPVQRDGRHGQRRLPDPEARRRRRDRRRPRRRRRRSRAASSSRSWAARSCAESPAPVETFRVLGIARGRPEQPLGPLVGRDFELTVLERAIDGLAEGRGTIVSIVGEPGIGKSRLVAEARRVSRPDPLHRGPRRLVRAATSPYWPIRDLLREWLESARARPRRGCGWSSRRSSRSCSARRPTRRTRSSRACSASRSSPRRPSGSASSRGRASSARLRALQRARRPHRARVVRLPRPRGPALGGRVDARAARGAPLRDRAGGGRARLPLPDRARARLLAPRRASAPALTRTDTARSSSRRSPTTPSRALAASVAGAELPESVAQLLAVRVGRKPVLPRGSAARPRRARARSRARTAGLS